ncbi:MAG TPA: phosphate-starvation-inducible PsiE family protein [Acidobacteriota bacterium]
MARRWIPTDWSALTFYQRIESLIALLLTFITTLVILVALYRLILEVVGGLVFGALNPLEHSNFQTVFGEIMTVLIALEFNHTLRYVVTREQSVIQTKVVLLIALLALARKFIILDLNEMTSNELFGLGAVTLALGITCWLLPGPENHSPFMKETKSKPGEA